MTYKHLYLPLIILLCLGLLRGGDRQFAVTQAQESDLDSNPIITKYAEGTQVSYAEATRRLALQTEMSALANRVADGEPTYAGSWIEHKPTFRLVVAFAEPDGEMKLAKYLAGLEWADLVAVKQSPFTLDEQKDTLLQVIRLRDVTDIPFDAGTDYRTGKVQLYTPNPDKLRQQIEALSFRKQYHDALEYVYQESLSQLALGYPYLIGGLAISDCTIGFVLQRKRDNRRFMSTAGHCLNAQTVDGISLGPVVDEYNPEPTPPIGSGDADFQAHNAAVRNFDLTNVIRIGSPGVQDTAKVVSYKLKGTTQGKWVCKHGKVTGFTCGTVVNINFTPRYAQNPGTYVRVTDKWTLFFDIACPGDSGAPVFEQVTDDSVSGLGILSSTSGEKECDGGNFDFIYTPTDGIDRFGYRILTAHYPQYFYQNLFSSDANCQEHRVPVDDNGNLLWSSSTLQACQTSAPGSGSMQSYTAYVTGDYLHEALWRGNKGYIRHVPLKSNGQVDWSNAPVWQQCCRGTAPAAQGAFVVGNHFYQNVFWSATNCEQFKIPLNDNGNPIWSSSTSQPCRTSIPGSGTIESYTVYVKDGYIHEALWQGGKGYIRNIPLNWNYTEIDWSSPSYWYQCCTGTGHAAQGGYILTHQ